MSFFLSVPTRLGMGSFGLCDLVLVLCAKGYIHCLQVN